MKLVRFEPEKHYGLICDWWLSHGWPAVPLDHLPVGYLVEGTDGPICAGFLYYTSTAFAVFEFIVARKDCEFEERAAALDVLISGVKLLAAQAGVKSLFTSMKHEGLIAKLTNEHGFVQTDSGMTNLIGRV